MNKHMVILDDTSKDSKLHAFVDAFYNNEDFMIVQLDHYPIAPLGSADAQLKLDQFNTLARLLSRASKITLATHFVWGGLNGRSKVFLDRFTSKDIQSLDLGHKWFGKSFNVLAIGKRLTYSAQEEHVYVEFCKAFDLRYEGLFYWQENEPTFGDMFETEREAYLAALRET